jgi:hypothetical protein
MVPTPITIREKTNNPDKNLIITPTGKKLNYCSKDKQFGNIAALKNFTVYLKQQSPPD